MSTDRSVRMLFATDGSPGANPGEPSALKRLVAFKRARN
jgi:hypothetical protein